MKFSVVWLAAPTGIVEADDIKIVERSVLHRISRLDNPNSAKLLSIHRVDPPPLSPIASAA
jgi:hypothetical protein